MAPMTRGLSPRNIPSSEVARYYRRRAKGGSGLIITECTFIDHPVANSFIDAPAFHGEDALNGWKRVVDEVHTVGGKIMPQIWHAGPSRMVGTPPNGNRPSIGPVDVFKHGKKIVTHMSLSDIATVINAFGKAALVAKDIGFDGVEIHGAHSYLLDSFLWCESNQRKDEYGGSLKSRVRFASKVIASVRRAVGSEFPICFRFSQWKLTDYEAKNACNAHDLEILLIPLVKAGVDIFHVSTRRFWEPAFSGSSITLAGWVKKITGKPVIAVGNVGIDQQFSLDMISQYVHLQPQSIEKVEGMLESGEFDLIAVGRAMLADPEWANKIRAGNLRSIVAFSSDRLATLN
jgi:2,4-dienoyl-CoA reductase-like NADH-dependent reductase (Old Yellow Enzyme family)